MMNDKNSSLELSIDLVLASSSPRRQAFFRVLGPAFRSMTADIDETPLPGESPVAMVARLAGAKAQAVADKVVKSAPRDKAGLEPGQKTVIVAADTTVALDGEILGKPRNAQDAWEMLVRLRGRAHEVHSAVALLEPGNSEPRIKVNSTTVVMREYTDAEITEYVDSGDPLDKAGGYALQHPEFAPAAELRGCVASVVGLPLNDLIGLIVEAGVTVTCEPAPICEGQAAFSCCTRELAGQPAQK